MKRPATRGKLGRLLAQATYTLLLVGLCIPSPTAQARTLPIDNKPMVPGTPSANPLNVVVYGVDDAAHFKVHLTNNSECPVTIRLHNEQGQVLYQEIVNQPAYHCKFNLSALPDATYSLEVRTKGERQVKQIRLKTKRTRRLAVR